MRIGILTLPQETNYGGILQAFALQRVLRDMGHDAVTIDRHNRKEYPSLKMHIAGYCKRLFQHYVQGRRGISNKWNPFVSEEDLKKSSVETQRFIDRNIRLTRRVFSDELATIEEEYQFDAYVVGSDQVWLDNYCPASFLDFVKRQDVRRITYAASCGKKSFFNNATKLSQCHELSKQFNGISVREQQLVEKCRRYLGIDAQWVLDPTMLLNPDVYLDAAESSVGDEPVLFSYILDSNPEKDSLVNRVSEKLRLQVVNGNRVRESGESGKAYPPVDDWVKNISRAGFVITDSFHGTVFSILFNKPFLSIGNVKRGIGRFQSLLEKFSLTDRLLTSINHEMAMKIVDEAINFDKVNSILNIERANSLDFLIKSLG